MVKSFQNTGIKWMESIPSHWELRRVKSYFSFSSEEVGDSYKDYQVLSLSVNGEGVIVRDMESGKGKYSLSMDKYMIVNPDSIVLCLFDMDVTPRIVGYVHDKGIITSAYTNIVPKENIYPKFYYYFFLRQDINKSLKAQGTGVRTTLTNNQFGAVKIPVPPLPEQKAIASYLDSQIEKITHFIQKKEQLIELLKEQRQGIINKAVTKGIDPEVRLKDSGIDWLGEIPEHWEVIKLIGVSEFVRGNSSFKKDELLSNGKYVALQYGKTYKEDEIDESFQFYVNDEFYKDSQIVNYGDVVIVSTSETIEDLGHSVFYKRSDIGLIGGEQILLKPKADRIDGNYLYYCSKLFTKNLQKYATGVKVFRFNISHLKTINATVPPIEEQLRIVSYIKSESNKIDQTISIAVREIELIKEYKEAMIAEAVLGKLEIE